MEIFGKNAEFKQVIVIAHVVEILMLAAALIGEAAILFGMR